MFMSFQSIYFCTTNINHLHHKKKKKKKKKHQLYHQGEMPSHSRLSWSAVSLILLISSPKYFFTVLPRHLEPNILDCTYVTHCLCLILNHVDIGQGTHLKIPQKMVAFLRKNVANSLQFRQLESQKNILHVRPWRQTIALPPVTFWKSSSPRGCQEKVLTTRSSMHK